MNKKVNKLPLIIGLIVAIILLAVAIKKSNNPVPSSTSEQANVVKNTKEKAVTANVAEPDPEKVEEPVDPRILLNEDSSNEKYTWNESIITYEEDDKIQYVNLQIKEKESDNLATADIVVNLNDMSATCKIIYSINDVVADYEYECNENGLKAGSAKSETDALEEQNRSGYEKIVSDAIYKVFH